MLKWFIAHSLSTSYSIGGSTNSSRTAGQRQRMLWVTKVKLRFLSFLIVFFSFLAWFHAYNHRCFSVPAISSQTILEFCPLICVIHQSPWFDGMGSYQAAIIMAVAEDVGHTVFECVGVGSVYNREGEVIGIFEKGKRVHLWSPPSAEQLEQLRTEGFRQVFPMRRQ